MKKLLLTTVILFTFALLQGQNYTFEDFKSVYDSILAKENTFFFTKAHSFRERHLYKMKHYIYYIDSKDKNKRKVNKILLSRRYELERMKYLEQYLTDSFPNVRRVALELIVSIGINSRNPQIRQRAVNDVLDSYFSVIVNADDYLVLFYIPDYDSRAKKRIKEILMGVKKQQELDFMRDFTYANFLRYKSSSLEEEARYIAGQEGRAYEEVRDSLFNDFKNYYYGEEFEKELKKRPPGGVMFMLPGYLYMYDFIPQLERLLKKHKSFTWEIKLSLARLGVEKYTREFLQYNKDDYGANYFSFINTQEAAEFFIKNNDTVVLPLFSESSDYYFHICYEAYYNLQTMNWIRNFPSRYKLSRDYFTYFPKTERWDVRKKDKKKFEKGRRWLNRHIGKFDLNPEWWHM